MVRLLVRKSLLSAWTSSRWYGRRRAAHSSGRCLHRRTVAAAAAASAAQDDDDEGRDIRLGVLFFSCCDSSDGTSCYSCCCCVTDEECRDVVDTIAVSRRRSRCALRRSVVRRCSARVVFVASLFVFFTLTTFYTSPASTTTDRDRGDGNTPSSSSSVVLLPPVRDRHRTDTSGTSASAASALLAAPDCDAIIAGDRAEIASTQRMLFRETRSTSSTFGASPQLAVNCTSAFQRPATSVGRSSTSPPLAYIISDAGGSVEQMELHLRAVYATTNVYCLTFNICSESNHVATKLRRLASCFNNIIVVEDACCIGPGFRPRDRKRNATTTAWWRCVDRLLRHRVGWTHVVGLTVSDFPLRPRDDIARRLATEKFDIGRRTGNDVIQCGAYTRSAVSQPSALLRTKGNDSENASSITTRQSHSPGGASALEVCARKCEIADHNANMARCCYTVADLPSLVRQRKLFAHAFDLNIDHYAVRCLMQRIVK